MPVAVLPAVRIVVRKRIPVGRRYRPELIPVGQVRHPGDVESQPFASIRAGLSSVSLALTGLTERRSRRRSSWALSATTTVEADMRMAPTAGDKVMPAKANTPAASGMATTL